MALATSAGSASVFGGGGHFGTKVTASVVDWPMQMLAGRSM